MGGKPPGQARSRLAQGGELLDFSIPSATRSMLEGRARVPRRPGRARATRRRWSPPQEERLVDLEDVDREPVEVAERRVAGAEVVDRQPDAERLELRSVATPGRLGPEHRLGDLQHQRGGRSRGSSTVVHARPTIGLGWLLRRDVHADGEAAPGWGLARTAPPGGRPSRSTQRPSGTISPVSSASGDELVRRNQPAAGVLPADQRLDARDRPSPGRRSAGSARGSSRGRARAAGRPRARAARAPVVHRGLEPRSCPCRRAWPGTSRRRRPAAGPRRQPRAGGQCPDAADAHHVTRSFTVDAERGASWIVHRGRPRAARPRACILEQHGELVAAQPRDRVAGRAAQQPLGHLDQQLVAGGVAEAVVDRLEVVEVEEEHGDLCRRAGARERLAGRGRRTARGWPGRSAGRGTPGAPPYLRSTRTGEGEDVTSHVE